MDRRETLAGLYRRARLAEGNGWRPGQGPLAWCVGEGVDMSNLGFGDGFRSSEDGQYIIEADPGGPWVNQDGKVARLVSVNLLGEPRWAVSPVSRSTSQTTRSSLQ